VLYSLEAFERLTDKAWDERRVRDEIAGIAADAEAAYDADTLWPAEEWESWQTPLPLKTLYVGGAGVLWALDALRRRGYAEPALDLGAAAGRIVERWREEPDLMRGVELPRRAESGLLSGETGILLVAWRLTGEDALAADLLARVRESPESEANEVMWGAPGALVAANAMARWTGAGAWTDARRELAEAVWRERDADGLWTQRLYGEEYRGLAAPHGVGGNVQPLLAGDDLLDGARREALRRETAAVLARSAIAEDGLANWPGAEGEPLRASDGVIKLQWCQGAPGIVVAAAEYLDEELLLAGAELVWNAGPHGPEKGSGICHGTAGNGYALLKAFARTGDEVWLERARRFAVHALAQVGRARVARGRGRYALWTGDVGAALFAADCLDGRPAYPVLDGLD
jgi:hypothetical protein